MVITLLPFLFFGPITTEQRQKVKYGINTAITDTLLSTTLCKSIEAKHIAARMMCFLENLIFIGPFANLNFYTLILPQSRQEVKFFVRRIKNSFPAIEYNRKKHTCSANVLFYVKFFYATVEFLL